LIGGVTRVVPILAMVGVPRKLCRSGSETRMEPEKPIMEEVRSTRKGIVVVLEKEGLKTQQGPETLRAACISEVAGRRSREKGERQNGSGSDSSSEGVWRSGHSSGCSSALSTLGDIAKLRTGRGDAAVSAGLRSSEHGSNSRRCPPI